MAGGFRYIMGAVAGILLVFVVWSLWPQLVPPRGTPAGSPAITGRPAQPAPPYPQRPNPPAARSYPSSPGGSAQVAAQPQPALTQAVATLKDDPEMEPAKFALRKDVVLLVEPDGDPHRPSCISHAPLTILRGTTILRIKEEGDWAMVSSPSRTLGWIPAAALKRPSELAVGL